MKKRNIIHSALSLSLTAALCLSMAACGGTQPPADSSAASAAPAQPAAVQPAAEEPTSTALPVKALHPKQVDENPYMAKSDANIHHDGYNTDSTDEILPLAIYPEINVSYETTNANASPAIYFDSYGHAVVPLLGGIAIRDLNAEETKTLGYFSPKKHDGGGYVIQSSYTFLDASNRIVCPTSNNHVLMLRATDESGNVLPEFEKVLDIDIKAAAEAALGKELTQNLLSVVFDYDGNLWFATGGFRIYPQRQQQGVIGYIAHSAIDAILNGKQTDLSKAVFVHELTPGEGAENGIAASKEASTILYRDVLLTGSISIFTLFLIFLFRKELKLMAFDPDYAAVLGFPRGKLNVFLSFLATITVLLSIQAVGIILMSAMLIAPAVAARQWTRRLAPMILLSAVIGALSSAIGTTASSLIPKMPTGPAIVVALSFFVIPGLLLAPQRGILSRCLHKKKMAALAEGDHL